MATDKMICELTTIRTESTKAKAESVSNWKKEFRKEHKGFGKDLIEKAIAKTIASICGNETQEVLYSRAQNAFISLI